MWRTGLSHNSCEIMTFNTEKWRSVDPYSYEKHFQNSAAVYFQSGFFFFGGAKSWHSISTQRESLDRIAKLDTKTYKWSAVGKLNTPRADHSVILIDNEVYLFGGSGSFPLEKCSLRGKTVKCTDLGFSHIDLFQPQMFLVSPKYCPK